MTSREELKAFFDALSTDGQNRCFLTMVEIINRSPNPVIGYDDATVKRLQAEGVTPWPQV